MKSFQQFMEQPEIINIMKGFAQQNKLNTTNTQNALKNVFSGKGVGELTQKVKSGEINIGDMKNLANSDELKSGLENVVQGIGKDANINVTKFLKKVENFKLPKK